MTKSDILSFNNYDNNDIHNDNDHFNYYFDHNYYNNNQRLYIDKINNEFARKLSVSSEGEICYNSIIEPENICGPTYDPENPDSGCFAMSESGECVLVNTACVTLTCLGKGSLKWLTKFKLYEYFCQYFIYT